jgi:crotonobetainyl-CoA:carnitine CoA-transferase CaiB-like acyl-CoA transferase
MESLLPEYDAFGAVRGAAGSALPGIVPRLAETPGRLRTPAPLLGQHNDEVLGKMGWPARAD